MWHGLAAILFKGHIHKNIDNIFFLLIIICYVAIHFVLFIWMRSACLLRNELNDKVDGVEMRQKKSQSPYQSAYNLVAEVDDKNRFSSVNQKRQSIFNMAATIDEFESMKNYSKKRRLSHKVKDFISNINLHQNSSNLNATKPLDKNYN